MKKIFKEFENPGDYVDELPGISEGTLDGLERKKKEQKSALD